MPVGSGCRVSCLTAVTFTSNVAPSLLYINPPAHPSGAGIALIHARFWLPPFGKLLVVFGGTVTVKLNGTAIGENDDSAPCALPQWIGRNTFPVTVTTTGAGIFCWILK